MEEYTTVPASNLRRYFIQLTGQPPNVAKPLTPLEMQAYLDLVPSFLPKEYDQHLRYFTDDEEEMFMVIVEEFANAAFPYDSDMLERLASNAGKLVYGNDFRVGRKWRLGFERRFKSRLRKVKCGSICRSRGKKANGQVRDTVFKKFKNFLDQLVKDGKFTAEQASNLEDHMFNADEVGGDERGKSKKKSVQWGNSSGWN